MFTPTEKSKQTITLCLAILAGVLVLGYLGLGRYLRFRKFISLLESRSNKEFPFDSVIETRSLRIFVKEPVVDTENSSETGASDNLVKVSVAVQVNALADTDFSYPADCVLLSDDTGKRYISEQSGYFTHGHITHGHVATAYDFQIVGNSSETRKYPRTLLNTTLDYLVPASSVSSLQVLMTNGVALVDPEEADACLIFTRQQTTAPSAIDED
jgi:hypothetical protein